MTLASSLQSSTYEALEVAPPENVASRYVRRSTLLLVGLNTLALVASYLDIILPGTIGTVSGSAVGPAGASGAALLGVRERIYGAVETLSTTGFLLEYVLRLWSAPAAGPDQGRVRFALRGFQLIDLAAVLPFFVALGSPTGGATLAVLRVGWAVRHLKLLRYLWARPVVPESAEALLRDAQERLAQVRHSVAGCRERDLARVGRSLQDVCRLGSAVAIRQRDDAQREGGGAAPPPPGDGTDALTFLSRCDQLADDLANPVHIAAVAALLSEAYARSAAVFDDAPDDATVQEVLASAGRVGEKRVPLRRIGRQHFAVMAGRRRDFDANAEVLYVPEVRREVARLQATLAAALAVDGPREDDLDLNRAINELRDVGVPARLAWDGLLFQLEEEHNARLKRVRVDLERHGSLSRPLGVAGRWVGDRLLTLRRALQAVAARVWATPRQKYHDGVGAVRRTVVPALQRWGILKVPTRELLRALDEARLETVNERGLPATYLDLFSLTGVQDETILVDCDAEFAQIGGAIARWRAGQETSFVVSGHPGSGKSTLLGLVHRRFLARDPVTFAVVTTKRTTVDELVAFLAELLACPGAGSAEALAERLLSQPPRVVLLDDCHHLFLRAIGGLDAIRRLFWLVAKTNHHVLWGLSFDQCSYAYLSYLLPLRQLLDAQVQLQSRSGEELRRLIISRHTRAGLGLHYESDKSNAKAARRRLKLLQVKRPGQVTRQEALELTFFEQLAGVCAGNITAAMYYWLRALDLPDGERAAVRPFAALNLGLIWQLSSAQAFLLAAVLQHGRLTAPELAAVMNADVVSVRLDVEILGKHNILAVAPGDDSFAVNPVVLKTVCDMLQARHVLY